MNRRTLSFTRAGPAVALGLVVLAAVLMAGCTSQSRARRVRGDAGTGSPASAHATHCPQNGTVTKLEVFHFHPTR